MSSQISLCKNTYTYMNLQSVTKFLEKAAIWTVLCFSPIPPLNNVEEQWVKLASNSVMGSQHCIAGDGEF